MPVTKGEYALVETQVYDYLKSNTKLNTAAICGILANIERESTFNPRAINSSSGAYGLCQWLGSRKESLQKLPNYNTVSTQMKFLISELNSYESKSMAKLSSVEDSVLGASDAGAGFSKLFERHGNTSEDLHRAGKAGVYYNFYAGGSSSGPIPSNPIPSHVTRIVNIGQNIVQAAANKQGFPYVNGGTGPDNFDSAGLIYHSYKEAGYDIPDLSVDGYYQRYKESSKIISSNEISAGDLLFYKSAVDNTLEYVAIATGDGRRVYIKDQSVLVDSDIGNPKYIIRILADSETSQESITLSLPGDGTVGTINTLIQEAMEFIHSQTEEVVSGLSRTIVSSGGPSGLGSLIDTVTGSSFVFYIPDEYTVQAGAQWEPVDLAGRSVTVLAYKATASRKISLSLDLYAGEGLYKSANAMSKMYSDVHFVNSLEYPDYTSSILTPPHKVCLSLGDIEIHGVVSGVSVEYKKPLDSSGRSMHIQLSFTVTEVAENPMDCNDVRGNSYSVQANKYYESKNTYDYIMNTLKNMEGDNSGE